MRTRNRSFFARSKRAEWKRLVRTECRDGFDAPWTSSRAYRGTLRARLPRPMALDSPDPFRAVQPTLKLHRSACINKSNPTIAPKQTGDKWAPLDRSRLRTEMLRVIASTREALMTVSHCLCVRLKHQCISAKNKTTFTGYYNPPSQITLISLYVNIFLSYAVSCGALQSATVRALGHTYCFTFTNGYSVER